MNARRILDRIEAAVWAAPDEQAAAAGFQVTRTSWRRRTYRHPRVAAALAARAATPTSQTTVTRKSPTVRPSATVDPSERAA
jgi:hypothetical protein